jgi:uncharacterized protein
MEPASSHCIGCGRTIGEIASWSRLTDPEKQKIVDALSARISAMTTRAVRGSKPAPSTG